MIPIWISVTESLVITGLVILLIWREHVWFHRHDALQDKHIDLLKEHRDLLQERNALYRNMMRHDD